MKPKQNLDQVLNKALQYFQTGNDEMALKQLNKFCKKTPKNALPPQEIGAFLQQNKMPLRAEAFYLMSLGINNDQASVHFNLGVIYQNTNQTNQAIQSYEKAIHIDPQYAKAFANLGYLYNEAGEKEKCSHACLSAQALDPDNPQIKHMIAALGITELPEQADKQYIENLYNEYAGYYDDHLGKTLKSIVPQLIHDTCSQFIDLNKDPITLLDLGCGTGVCGETFAKHSIIMNGVDLSENMVKEAEKKNIYSQLFTADITQHLKDCKKQFDVIFSSDVLIYIGDLNALFKEAHRSLNIKGVFTFSVESSSDTESNYILDASGRYKHNHQYITKLAKDNKFNVLSSDESTLREQNKQAVLGRVYVLTPK